eukprot:14920368-Ditylum_brightwellii.AAC.1
MVEWVYVLVLELAAVVFCMVQLESAVLDYRVEWHYYEDTVDHAVVMMPLQEDLPLLGIDLLFG